MSSIAGLTDSLKDLRLSLAAQVQDIESTLSALDTLLARVTTVRPSVAESSPAASKTRAGGLIHPVSLKDFIRRVLARSGIMSVADVTAGIRKAGYRTKNKTLSNSVSVALAEMNGVEKVGHGRYRMK